MQKRWIKNNPEKSTGTINSSELHNSKRENKKKWQNLCVCVCVCEN